MGHKVQAGVSNVLIKFKAKVLGDPVPRQAGQQHPGSSKKLTAQVSHSKVDSKATFRKRDLKKRQPQRTLPCDKEGGFI